jgi:hypothetical protein
MTQDRGQTPRAEPIPPEKHQQAAKCTAEDAELRRGKKECARDTSPAVDLGSSHARADLRLRYSHPLTVQRRSRLEISPQEAKDAP